jgi:hypothetical protein
MCRISKVAPDWVTKGCHIHVAGIELALRPDQSGGIIFKKMFTATPEADADAAARQARAWLQEPANRRALYQSVFRAREFLATDFGLLTELACGRRAELTFLLAAIRRMGI